MRGVSAAGARRPRALRGPGGAAGPWGSGPDPTPPARLGCRAPRFAAEGRAEGARRWRRRRGDRRPTKGSVTHFNNPEVQASLAANTWTITGHAEAKQLREMLLSILNHLGVDNLTSFKKTADALPTQSVDGKASLATREEDDDEVPNLAKNFDEASKNGANQIESTSEEDKT
ncbi:transcription factor BTF3-like [Canis lupus dingo]|uniref:transcription factor BTF3-like n=1 Tax=Canis lupus dingo TaxID=286419 RepID=UPI0020C411B8|nr:transcription factor BTF3-like [Canis lupus dingo]